MARQGQAATRSRQRRPQLEVAIDVVLEHLHASDEDGRHAILERLSVPFGLRLSGAKRRKLAKSSDKPQDGGAKPAQSDPFLSAAENALFVKVNAKLAASGDARRLTALKVPLLGVPYAVEGPLPDGKSDIEGGLSQADVVTFARKLGIKA